MSASLAVVMLWGCAGAPEPVLVAPPPEPVEVPGTSGDEGGFFSDGREAETAQVALVADADQLPTAMDVEGAEVFEYLSGVPLLPQGDAERPEEEG